MWKNRNVLVTGATGLLGSHLVSRLIEQEARVVVIVRDYIPQSYYYQGAAWMDCREVTGDILDADLVHRVVNEYQVETIFHLAAQTQVRVANQSPVPTLRTNILGTVNVLEAARLNLVEEVVVASSDKAYGSSDHMPYDESTPLQGQHPYDVSKSCADLLAQMYRATYGMKVGITRCGNLFGPGDLNFDRLIPGAIQAILSGERPVIRSDGKMIRDYFYVKDAVHAYICLAEHLHEKLYPLAAFNFSYGDPVSVLTMVRTIQKVMGDTSTPEIQGRASNEIYLQYLNSSLARQELNWQPGWTLEEALKETVEWYQENTRNT